jgi:hypothetical protein
MKKLKKESMKKIIFATLFLMIANYSFSQVSLETIPEKQKTDYKYSEKDEKKQGLWKDFYKTQIEYFGEIQEINLYAENDSFTKICFICEKGLFVFSWNKSEGNIEKTIHAKHISYKNINRITFERNNGLGFFKLWYNQREELAIGASGK